MIAWDQQVLALWGEHKRAMALLTQQDSELNRHRVIATFTKFAHAFDPDSAWIVTRDFTRRVMAGERSLHRGE